MSDPWDFNPIYEFYQTHRKSPEELFRSEKYFLEKIQIDDFKILDIGCALGGFSDIFSTLGKNISYTGVDVSKKMVEGARRLRPNSEFFQTDANLAGLPFEKNSFDLVFSTGIFHLNSCWKEMYTRAYDFSRKYTLIDFRIDPNRSEVGKMTLNYGKNNENPPEKEYIVLKLEELIEFFSNLIPKPLAISSYGYMHPISIDATLSMDSICMAFFLVEKPSGKETYHPKYHFELPKDFDPIISRFNGGFLVR